MVYVLDTDTIGFAQQLHPNVLQRIRQLAVGDRAVTTIITFGED